MTYNKQALECSDLIALLKQRGMIVRDEAVALEQLRIISYFRLAGYWRPMEADKTTHQFKSGSTFENALSLYYFDKKLRALLFTVIQGVEIALRTKLIHHVSLKYGPMWLTDANIAFNIAIHQSNLAHIQADIQRSREEFIQEHFQKYPTETIPPSWKTLEVVTFGTLSKLFYNLKDNSVKRQIAMDFYVPHQKFLESWVKSIAVLRNTVAHHARLWNRNYPTIPLLPPNLPQHWISTMGLRSQKIYAQICVLQYLHNAIHPNNTFALDLKELLSRYPNVDIAAMGFPSTWANEPLWK